MNNPGSLLAGKSWTDAYVLSTRLSWLILLSKDISCAFVLVCLSAFAVMKKSIDKCSDKTDATLASSKTLPLIQ